MSTVAAPSPWPAPAAAPAAAAGRGPVPWRSPADGSLRWELRRNCSVTPRQLLAAYLMLCTVSLSIAAAFWWLGAPYVLAFAAVEQVALMAALLAWARHAGDRETLTLSGGELVVEQRFGANTERTAFRAEWLSVEPAVAQGSMVELAGQGRRVRVGRHLRPELRAGLARELRRALRQALVSSPTQESELELQR
jgi:uncharacterized membrane protein